MIQTLTDRIGWKPQGSLTPSAANQTSNSGLFYQGYHSLVTLANVDSTREENTILDEALADYTKHAAIQLISDVFTDGLIENHILSQSTETKDTDTLENGFVGVKIKYISKRDVTAFLNSCTAHFNGAENLTLYLFQSNINNPIWTGNLTTLADTETLLNINQELNTSYRNADFYLGFYSNGITARPIDKIDWCNRSNLISVIPFYVAGHTALTIFDTDDVVFTSSVYLNVDVSLLRDYSELVKIHASMFDDALGYSVAAKVLESIKMSVRSNRNERLSKEVANHIEADLQGNTSNPNFPFFDGLYTKYRKEVNKIKKTLFKKSNFIATIR